MIIRKATAADWPEVTQFFLGTPLHSGTSFVLDRSPDFGALPALRGESSTFLAYQHGRLAGTLTALWRPGRDGVRRMIVGELIDLRVVPSARGGRVAYQLLRAAHETFLSKGVDWILCLIGERNAATVPLVARQTGLPRLEPLDHFASVHFIAAKLPAWPTPRGLTVRCARPSDAPLLSQISTAVHNDERFSPPEPIHWPDPTHQHRAWLAFDANGSPRGALVTWDGESLRRLRIVRYRAADAPLRIAARVASYLGIANALPAPGSVFRLWATRTVHTAPGDDEAFRALLRTALAAAAAAGQSALQVNLRQRDPLMLTLPHLPRSVFRSTLYGGLCDGTAAPPAAANEHYHADIARV